LIFGKNESPGKVMKRCDFGGGNLKAADHGCQGATWL
jgi:hypothetical protein